MAHDAIRIQIKAQEELRELKECATGKEIIQNLKLIEALEEKVNAFAKQKVYEIANGKLSKHERSDKFSSC